MKSERQILKPSDFTSLLDLQSPRKTTFGGKVVIEGVTTTDQYQIIGYTYWPSTGHIVMKNRFNQIKYRGILKKRLDFDNALKKADKKI